MDFQQKGKMEKSKQPHKPLDIDEEDIRKGVEDLDSEEGELITRLPKSIHPQKGKVKVPKDLDNAKFTVSTPLFSEKVPFKSTQGSQFWQVYGLYTIISREGGIGRCILRTHSHNQNGGLGSR